MAVDPAALLAVVRGEPVATRAIPTPPLPAPPPQPAAYPLPADRPSAAKAAEPIPAPSTDQDLIDPPDDDFGVSYRPRREQSNMQHRRWSRPLPPIPLVAIDRPEEPVRLDWWRQPVAGWREGLLVLHNIARNETFAIPLQAGGTF